MSAGTEKLTSLEAKLFSLVLDPNAAQGEVVTGAQKLIESWRKRGVTVQQFTEPAWEGLPVKQSAPDFGLCTMLWGKNKGKFFMDVSPSELRSAAKWASSMPDTARKFADFISNVEKFLAHSR